MKLLKRTALAFLTVFVLVTAAYASTNEYSTYKVTGGNLLFHKSSRTIAACDGDVEKLVIPARIDGIMVTSIGKQAFAGVESLTSVKFPNSASAISIGDEAFAGCKNLTDVKLSNSVTSIGSRAFWECESLTSITISDNVTSLEEGLFAHCSSLESVTIPDGVKFMGKKLFFDCKSLLNVTIPNGVKSVGDETFSGCENLISVEIPKGVGLVRRYTFAGCESMESVTIPNSVTAIGDNAFAVCKSLTEIQIPDSVTSIASNVFAGCAHLTSVELPDSVTSIGDNVFSGCIRLTEIRVDADNANYLSADGVLFNKKQTALLCYPAKRAATSYQIPSKVTTLDEIAFVGATNLISVMIPHSVTAIDGSAFSGCTNLTSVSISNSVTTVGENAFEQCDNLRDVYYAGSEAQWKKIDGISDSPLSAESVTVHYSSFGPELRIPYPPIVQGHTVGKADLKKLTEISIPVSMSASAPTSVKVCVPFFDGGGRFLGAGFTMTDVKKDTDSVAVPVTDNVSGAQKFSVIIMNADSLPMISALSFDVGA